MGLFDSANRISGNSYDPRQGNNAAQNKTVEIVFDTLPDNFEQFKTLEQSSMDTPFKTAALTVLAFCFYPHDREACVSMLNFLRGPRPLGNFDLQFIRDRFMDKDYVPRSYFKGAVPQNDYQPSQPYTVAVSENPYSYTEPNYAKLYVKSGGADSPRAITLRLAKDGKWYLWEQYILAGIREPESLNPWA